jgi:hypothetical protein
MITLLALLACAPEAPLETAPKSTTADEALTTILDCPADSNVSVSPLGGVLTAVIDTGSALILPLMQIQSDRVVVFCVEVDGVLTIEWSE